MSDPVIPRPFGIANVPDDSTAEIILHYRGLPDCCIADRISVSHGGPVTCDGSHHGTVGA